MDDESAMMDCSHYRELYERFMSFPMPRELSESDEYITWLDHQLICPSCGEWNLMKQVENAGSILRITPASTSLITRPTAAKYTRTPGSVRT